MLKNLKIQRLKGCPCATCQDRNVWLMAFFSVGILVVLFLAYLGAK